MTDTPLREKVCLFWHRVFATAATKLIQTRVVTNQISMFREHGMGSFDDLLIELSRDPAMIMWLDNQDNHGSNINENYGRELLELFSMGVGNYSEDDIKETARAFTGWTIGNTEYMALRAERDSIWPYGRLAWHYEFKENLIAEIRQYWTFDPESLGGGLIKYPYGEADRLGFDD